MYDIFFGHEHVAPRAVNKFWRHLIGNTFVITNRDHLVDQENRLIVRIDVVDLGVTVVQGCLLILPKLLQSAGNSESVVSLSTR